MDAALPFRPQGTGVMLAVTPTPASASLPAGPQAGDVCYLVYNAAGQADAWIGYGPTSVSAVANAQVPLALSAPVMAPQPGGGMFVAPSGTLQALTLGPNHFFAGKSLGSCSVWIAPGYGV
jgi:hypothetical protein